MDAKISFQVFQNKTNKKLVLFVSRMRVAVTEKEKLSDLTYAAIVQLV